LLKAPKQKGYRHEIECKEVAERHGLKAVRAFGSDGRAIGERSDVDVVITNPDLSDNDEFKKIKVQSKSRKAIPKYLRLGNANIKTFRENNNPDFDCLVNYEWLMKCLSRVQ
tara:strand:- start:6251 stop:6586 length:336 start_codon:yes stop_codon:yes gene_type:complete